MPGITEWSDIIAAVQSPLGLVTLVVLVVTSVAFSFFAREKNVKVRVSVFTLLWIGAAGVILVSASLGDSNEEPVTSCRALDEAAFAEVLRATGLSRDAIAKGDYEGDSVAQWEYRLALEAELQRKGLTRSEVGAMDLRELVLKARRECILP